MLNDILHNLSEKRREVWREVWERLTGKPSQPEPEPERAELVSNQKRSKPPRAFPPLEALIGNPRAGNRMKRSAYDAWTKSPRNAAGFNCAFIGPASSGKTEHARRFAEAVCLPFIEIQPQSVQDIGDVYEKIYGAVDGATIRNPITDEIETFHVLIIERDNDGVPIKVILPPCVVFIDEVHQTRPKVIQGLLKATEPSDRSMVTEDGIEIDTANVCWMIATTERGRLFAAFDTRFTKISLSLYSQAETAQIIKTKFPKLPDDACYLVAHYCRAVPREAMAFAREMMAEKKHSRQSWEDCAHRVADDNGIDEHGMTLQRLRIITELLHGPIPKNRLAIHVDVKPLELERFVLPPIMTTTPDMPEPLLTVCPKGYVLTMAGIAEADKRGIPYDLDVAIPEKYRR